MGSRAIVVVCRDADAARDALRRRDGQPARSTRAPAARSSTTPRSSRLLDAAAGGRRRPPGCGTSSSTDWLVLDGELMPWSAKAQELIRAPVRAGRRRRRAPALAAVARA